MKFSVPPSLPIFMTAEKSFLAFASLICLFPSLVLAQHDHRGDGMEGGTMIMYVHFTPGDSVLFGPWIPKTDQAVFRTCVGVFMLAAVYMVLASGKPQICFFWFSKQNKRK